LKPKTHVICLIQCGGLWFVNGKISITWNLKQAVVQKPKPSMEGQCFLKPKDTDKQRLKELPPPEDDVDPDGPVSATIIDDDEVVSNSQVQIPPAPAPVLTPAVQVETPVQSATPPPAVEEPKKKKVISKKKPEA
jgi:hypothetical protein